MANDLTRPFSIEVNLETRTRHHTSTNKNGFQEHSTTTETVGFRLAGAAAGTAPVQAQIVGTPPVQAQIVGTTNANAAVTPPAQAQIVGMTNADAASTAPVQAEIVGMPNADKLRELRQMKEEELITEQEYEEKKAAILSEMV